MYVWVCRCSLCRYVHMYVRAATNSLELQSWSSLRIFFHGSFSFESFSKGSYVHAKTKFLIENGTF